MTWLSQLIATFQRLYSRFRRTYENYLFNDDNGNYFMQFANVRLKVSSSKIPYYTSQNAAFQRGTPHGYLPNGLDAYYLRELPFYFVGYFKNYWMPYVVNRIKMTIGVKAFTVPVASIRDANAVKGLQLRFKPFINGQYREVFVNYDAKLMEADLRVSEAATFAKGVLGTLVVQDQLDATIKSLEIANNRLVLLLQNQKLPAAQKPVIEKSLAAVQANILALKNDPMFVVKVCTDCGGNARVGVVPVVVWVAALAIGGIISWVAIENLQQDAALARESAERLKARQINADRIANAASQLQAALSNPALTADQKKSIEKMLTNEAESAANDSGKLTAQQGDTGSGKGLFDRVENLLLIGGAIYIFGNLTKK